MFCLCVYACTPCVYSEFLQRPEEDFGSSGTRDTDRCESPSVGAGNQSWVFNKRSQGS